MAKKTIDVFLVSMTLFALSLTLAAQQQPDPNPLRFDVTAFLGYRTSMSFPVEPNVTGMNPRAVLDASPSYGVSFGISPAPCSPIRNALRRSISGARVSAATGSVHTSTPTRAWFSAGCHRDSPCSGIVKQGRFVATSPEQLNVWLGRESGKPVHVVTPETDLTSELKRGLAFARQGKKFERGKRR